MRIGDGRQPADDNHTLAVRKKSFVHIIRLFLVMYLSDASSNVVDWPIREPNNHESPYPQCTPCVHTHDREICADSSFTAFTMMLLNLPHHLLS